MEEIFACLLITIVATIIFFVMGSAACGITLWGAIFLGLLAFVALEEERK